MSETLSRSTFQPLTSFYEQAMAASPVASGSRRSAPHHETPPSSLRKITSPTGSEGTKTPSKRQGSSAGAGASLEARRARRAELRQFYGIKEAENNPQAILRDEVEEVLKPDSGNPLDIDSASFNSSKYYENLITTSSLSELMQKANGLGADVGNLQSSRHALVYNHHHQLFAAGDTIAQLNSRTPQLLGIMTSLQDSFSEISRLVDAIALPTEPKEDAQQGSWMKDIERLRLMRLAKEPDEKLVAYFETFRPKLEEASQDDPAAGSALKECLGLLPVIAAPKAEDSATAP